MLAAQIDCLAASEWLIPFDGGEALPTCQRLVDGPRRRRWKETKISRPRRAFRSFNSTPGVPARPVRPS